MKKMLVLGVFMCVLAVIVSFSLNAAISGQAVEIIPKVGGLAIDDGSGEDARLQGVPATEFDGFDARLNLDIQELKVFTTLAKDAEDLTLSEVLIDVTGDDVNDISVVLDGMSKTVVVSVDSNNNGIIGDAGDSILEPLAGAQEVADLALPDGSIMRTAAGTDEYNGDLYTQFSFDFIGVGTVIITAADGSFVVFELPPIEENCVDGIDNEGDSLVDCEDIDCIYEASCDTGKNKIAYNFRRLRAEAEETEGAITGEAVFNLAVSPRHHEAAFAEGPVHWSVTPMINDFAVTAAVSINPVADGVQIMATAKSPDLPDFPDVPQTPGSMDPGYGAEITFGDPDDGALMRAIMEAYARGCEDPVIDINNVGTLEITQTVGADTYTDVIPADRVRISGFITARDDEGPLDLQGQPFFIVTDIKILSFAQSTNLVSAASSDLQIKINSEIEFTGTLRDLVKEQHDFVNKQVTGTVDITGGPIPGKPGKDFEISGPTFIKRIN